MDKATAYKSNPLLRAFDQSEGSDERLIDLTRTTLSGIYYGLKEKNLYRWLNKQRVSEGLKNFVVEVMTEEDIKREAGAAGFYTPGTDRQKLNPSYVVENTNRHELFHFLTDYLKIIKSQANRYGKFLNEGFTEYLTVSLEKIIYPGKAKEEYGYVYEPNVDLVQFMHEIMGDGVIKSYLSGRTERSNKEFSTYLTSDGSENLGELARFQEKLNLIHSVIDDDVVFKDDNTQAELDDYNKRKNDLEFVAYPEIVTYVSNITINYVRKFAQNLEYIEDGKVDVDAICGDVRIAIMSLRDLIAKSGKDLLGWDEKSDLYPMFIEEVMNRAVSVAFREMGIEVDKDAKFTAKNPNNPKDSILNKASVREQANISEQELFLSMIQKRREKNQSYMNGDSFDMARFVMDISALVEKFNCDKKQIDMAISTILPEGIDKSFVSKLIEKYYKLYTSISYLEGVDKNETNETKLYQIEEGTYLVNRDGKHSTIHINPESGEYKETVGIGFIERDRRAEKVLDSEKDRGIHAYKIAKNSVYKKNHQVIIRDSDGEVRIDGSKAVAIEGFSRFAETLIIQEALSEITNDHKKYAYNLHDDDTPNLPNGVFTITNGSMVRNDSYILNFRGLKQDLDRVGSYLPAAQKNSLVEQALGKILKDVYGAKLEDFPEILTIMSNSELDKEQPSEGFMKKLINLSDKLNENKRTLYKATSIQGFIIPQNIPDRDKKVNELQDYFRKMEDYTGGKELKKQTSAMIKAQNEFKDSFIEKYSEGCIVESRDPQKSIANHLAMRGVVIPGFQASQMYESFYDLGKAKKVDYKLLCDALKSERGNIPAGKPSKKVLSDLVSSLVINLYGYTEELDRSGDTTEFFEFIKDSVLSTVLDDKELDVEEIKKREADYVGKLDASKKKSDDLMNDLVDQLEPTFRDASLEPIFNSMVDIIKDESMSSTEKEKMLEILSKRQRESSVKKEKNQKRMEAFARLALSGEHIPSEWDVKNAEKVLAYKEKEVEGGER